MARAKNYDDEKVRFGRGAAPASAGEHPERIGTKDPRQSRSKFMSFRVTESQDAVIRKAFEDDQSGLSFAEFAAGIMLDGLAARGAEPAVFPADIGAVSNSIDEAKLEIGERVAAAEGRIHQAARAIEDVAAKQDALGRVSLANAKTMRELSGAVGHMGERIDQLAGTLEKVLALLAVDRSTGGAAQRAPAARKLD